MEVHLIVSLRTALHLTNRYGQKFDLILRHFLIVSAKRLVR